MPFTQLGLSQPILRALKQEGYSAPTPIQAQTIPHAVAGRDVLGSARTGTGKTAAFALPILHRLSTATVDKSQRGPRKARALILSPTRELAVQIGESFGAYGRDTHLAFTVIYGGVSQHHQERAVRAGVDIIVATPGRLMDLMEQRIVDLSGIEIFVLDEADRMLDMGFIQPIRKIAATIKTANRQTLLFSATMPKEIVHLANSLLRDPVKIAVDPVSSAVPLIEQGLYMVSRNTKQSLLEHLLGDPAHKVSRALVFTRTKHGADKVGNKLLRAGIQAETIHGNKSQNQRKRALARFTTGAARVLVATDVAARGLDVDNISHVFNYDLPVEPEAYVHRIGRTGRAGAKGVALSFCDVEEREELRAIERLTGKKIPVVTTPTGLQVAVHVPRPAYAGSHGHSGHSRGGHSSHGGHGQAAHAPHGSSDFVESEKASRERKSRLQRNHGPAGGHPQKTRGHHEAPHSSDRAHAPRPAHGSHPKPRHGEAGGAGGNESHNASKPAHPHGHSKPKLGNAWNSKKSGHRKGPRPSKAL